MMTDLKGYRPSNGRTRPAGQRQRADALLLAATLAAAVPALAGVASSARATEPVAQIADHEEIRRGAELHDRLFAALKTARNEAEGRAIENEIWRFWLDEAPDPAIRALIDEAMAKRNVYDNEGAEALLDKAIAKGPDYAEAFNQRAFVRFLRDDLDGALEDADRALALEPKHFGAMAGRALILMRQGRARLAQEQLRQAVTIHPFLKERSMIVPAEPGSKPDPAPTSAPSPARGIDL